MRDFNWFKKYLTSTIFYEKVKHFAICRTRLSDNSEFSRASREIRFNNIYVFRRAARKRWKQIRVNGIRPGVVSIFPLKSAEIIGEQEHM